MEMAESLTKMDGPNEPSYILENTGKTSSLDIGIIIEVGVFLQFSFDKEATSSFEL